MKVIVVAIVDRRSDTQYFAFPGTKEGLAKAKELAKDYCPEAKVSRNDDGFIYFVNDSRYAEITIVSVAGV